MSIQLTLATTNDTGIIHSIAHKSWNAHYPGIISQSQIDYMFQKHYAENVLKQHMETKEEIFYLITHQKQTIGFISISHHPEEVYLNKFYMLPEFMGKGLGEEAFSQLTTILNPVSIRLNVNRLNFRSINFYFKMGFKIEKVADIDIGNGFVMNDFIMILDSPPKF